MQLIHFIRETTWSYVEQGWGNGYVAVPPEHPLHGAHYSAIVKLGWSALKDLPFNRNYIGAFIAGCRGSRDEISLDLLIQVHCGLTYSDRPKDWVPRKVPRSWWVFGFDTAHAGDNLERWPEGEVLKETLRLKWELYKYAKLNKNDISKNS